VERTLGSRRAMAGVAGATLYQGAWACVAQSLKAYVHLDVAAGGAIDLVLQVVALPRGEAAPPDHKFVVRADYLRVDIPS